MEFRIATARCTDVTAYLNASVNFATLLASKPKYWQTYFTTDKGFENFFFFSFTVIRLALEKSSKNTFSSSTSVLEEKL